MKELLRGESTKSLKAVVLKCPNAELYLLPLNRCSKVFSTGIFFKWLATDGVARIKVEQPATIFS
jgi:hypothetical protein